jgi:hypothetical protein
LISTQPIYKADACAKSNFSCANNQNSSFRQGGIKAMQNACELIADLGKKNKIIDFFLLQLISIKEHKRLTDYRIKIYTLKFRIV